MATKQTDSTGREYVVVAKGDTLGQIAIDFVGSYDDYKKLAAINNISNPDLIVVGQKIYLSESNTISKLSLPSAAVITNLGWQINSDNVVLVTWDWVDRTTNWDVSGTNISRFTDRFDVEWTYYLGDGIKYTQDPVEVSYVDRYCTYSPPSDAIRVSVRVMAVSLNSLRGEANDLWLPYYNNEWSTVASFNLTEKPPATPSKPSIRIEGYTVYAELDDIDENTDTIEFRLYKNDQYWVPPEIYATVKTNSASCAFTVVAGNTYKVQCRARNAFGISDWSGYTGNVETPPSASSGFIQYKATSETSVYLEWEPATNAKLYEIQYANNKDHLDNTNMASSITTEQEGVTHFTIGNLATGAEYFFRVRAKNDSGVSEWSSIVSVKIGTTPAAPTTWSSTTTVMLGETVMLYWLHNCEDGSDQTVAELIIEINGEPLDPILTASTEYTLHTWEYAEGANVQWRVRTAGVTGVFGDYSISRPISISAPATLELSITDIDSNPIETINAFPIRIKGSAGPNTQTPIGYHLTVLSNETYETTDRIGNRKIINHGETIYSKYFVGPDDLSVELSAGDIDLENNISYTISCVVSMDTGLRAESSITFVVGWRETVAAPNARIYIDHDIFTAHINPYCNDIVFEYYKVVNESGAYVVTSEKIQHVYGSKIDDLKTTTGEQVYYGTTGDGEEVYYCGVETITENKDVLLSVYRHEFDGSFTEIAKDIANNTNTYLTDPHPALDYARYRIVATDKTTGAVNYYDLPAYPVGGDSIIIQWDDVWSDFIINDNGNVSDSPAWGGSMVKLKANIDVSEKTNRDTSLANYIGRKHPVVYHGTQVGATASWSAVIPKDDVETLYALRRLSIWMGKVYVREPSGSGYWADVNVSFSKKHREMTIPVTLDVTRVEGGV